jgi:cation diffusion facilitator family transporter
MHDAPPGPQVRGVSSETAHRHSVGEQEAPYHRAGAPAGHPSAERGLWQLVGELFHAHPLEAALDDAMRDTTARGIRAVQVSLLALLATAALQLVVALLSGSAALLANTVHNFADALTALPLWLAYALGRRPPSRQYTYGYGRAEDLAGVAVVGAILLSALVAGAESWRKLLTPEPVTHLGWVVAAALLGFLGNEAVALYRIREGKAIGSAALVADGLHARADGLTSLAVLVGAAGVWLGVPLADPLVGLLITAAILVLAAQAGRQMWQRLMDAVDPALAAQVEATAAAVAGVHGVEAVRVRWLGHRLQAELHVRVDEDLSTRESHQIAEAVRHALFHALPQLALVTVHIDPCGHSGADPHAATAHHAPPGRGV